jgi:uncharacterized protein (TIGR02271 family)
MLIGHEELRVDKKTVETGRVRVRTHLSEQTAWVQEELAREDVEIEWVDVGREVDAVPEIRTEGDTLIIPLFEEVLVVEKRLVLRKEIHLTRRIETEPFEAQVPLRRVGADVERARRPGTNPPAQETPMRTLTAFYDSRSDAEDARRQLMDTGLSADEVTIAAADEGGRMPDHGGSHEGGFMQSLKNFFMPDEDRAAYVEGVNRGGVLLTARVTQGKEDLVIRILDESAAVDFDARQQEWRSAGGDVGRSQGADRGEDVAIPIAEERLRVGKREVDRGSVRVRSYVTEEPASEQVALREEHVNVERRPVDERKAGSPEGIFEERSFEVSERREEAVVGKETVVTEELHVTKDADERTETVEDTVRRTEVDVDDKREGRGERDEDMRRGH